SISGLIHNKDGDDAPTMGTELTAVPGNVTAPPLDVDYEWWISDDGITSWSKISFANSENYTPTTANVGKYLKVVITGKEPCVGTAEIITRKVFNGAAVTIAGKNEVGETLTGTVSPAAAYSEVDFQWQLGELQEDGNTLWTDIVSSINLTCTLTEEQVGKYIRLSISAKATSGYETPLGGALSNTKLVTQKLSSARISGSTTPNPLTGDLLTADVSPIAASNTINCSFQWYAGGFAISGATAQTYVVEESSIGKKIKVVVTPNPESPYISVVTSPDTATVKSRITSINLSNTTPKYGDIIYSSLLPSSANTTYKWFSSADGLAWTLIPKSTSPFFKVTDAEIGKYIKVQATGILDFTGTASAQTSDKTSRTITSVKLNKAIAYQGELLEATVAPKEAKVEYKWESSSDGVIWTTVGVNSSKYLPASADAGKYIRVTASGKGYYTGIESAKTARIMYKIIAGANQDIKYQSAKDLSISCSGDFAHFDSLTIEGTNVK
ncbi:MAG: hypothetical protein ACRCUS_01535, partial [Anaerovoracaceae bacterium]